MITLYSTLAHAAIPGEDTPEAALLGLAVIGGLSLVIALVVRATGKKGKGEETESDSSASAVGESEATATPDHHAGHDHPTDHDHHAGHGHSHEHGHTHEEPKGLIGRIKALYHPHSHDAADSLDSALESSALGIRAVKISLAGLLITAIFQVAIVVVTSSVALLADTIHNFSDAMTSIPLWIAFVIGRRAANRSYTYGYRRAEDLSGLFIVSVIALSAVLAGWESVERLLNPVEVENLGIVALAGFIGFVGNEIVAIYRIRIGRRIGSAALVADGYHARTDGLTSLAVVVSAAGVALGFPAADPIVGLAITVAILFILRDAGRQVFRRLMDAVEPSLVSSFEEVAGDVDGVLGVRQLRVRWVGHRLDASLHVEVSESLSLIEGHEIAESVRSRLFESFSKLDEVTVHVDPEGMERHHSKTLKYDARR